MSLKSNGQRPFENDEGQSEISFSKNVVKAESCPVRPDIVVKKLTKKYSHQFLQLLIFFK